jgi:hypothetical protein
MHKRVTYARSSLAVAAGVMLAVAALAGSTTARAATRSGAAHSVTRQSEHPLGLSTGSHFFTDDASGNCLDQDYNSGVQHPDVLAYPCTYGPNEVWIVIPNANGSFLLVNTRSGGCLTQTGGAATVYPCNSSDSQAWWHVSVDGLTWSFFVNKASGACLDQDYNSGVPHGDVLAWSPCGFGANEGWAAS